MASKEFNVVAIIYPKQGKTDEIISLLNEVSEYVRANEPGTLKYEINRSLRPGKDGNEEIIMIERYKDQQALKTHGTSAKFTAFQKTMGEKDLVRQPMLLKMVSEKRGFGSRL